MPNTTWPMSAGCHEPSGQSSCCGCVAHVIKWMQPRPFCRGGKWRVNELPPTINGKPSYSWGNGPGPRGDVDQDSHVLDIPIIYHCRTKSATRIFSALKRLWPVPHVMATNKQASCSATCQLPTPERGASPTEACEQSYRRVLLTHRPIITTDEMSPLGRRRPTLPFVLQCYTTAPSARSPPTPRSRMPTGEHLTFYLK